MLAFTFPGQGSQRPGMGRPWVDHESWELVEEASAISGRDVARLMLDADADELKDTRNAQLMTFVSSLMVLDAVERLGNRLPDPAVLFVLLMVLVWVASALLSGMSFAEIDPRSGKPLEIRNLLAGESLTAFMAAMVTTFTTFPPLGVVLVALLALLVRLRLVGLGAGELPRVVLGATVVALRLGVRARVLGADGLTVVRAHARRLEQQVLVGDVAARQRGVDRAAAPD